MVALLLNTPLDTAVYSLKLSIENCSQAAADGDVVTIDSLYEIAIALSYGTIADLATTYRLVTLLHDWHTIVGYDPSTLSKVNDFHVIWKPICDLLLVINSIIGHISHRDRRTDRRQLMPIARPLLKYVRSANNGPVNI